MTGTSSASSDSHRTAALVLCALLAAFAALHVYWALGGSWGLSAVIGTGPRPSTTGIWGMTFALGLFGLAALTVARAQASPPLAARIALWVLAAGAAIAGCVNIALGTSAAERFGIGPFAVAVALLAIHALRRPRVARAS